MTQLTHYSSRSALGAFFHANAKQAAALLPAGLRPLESHPGLAVLALTVFEFDATAVGPYRELVASIIVTPWAPRGETLPTAALFPVVLATTTLASRAHVTERWHLPQLDRCLAIELVNDDPGRRAAIVTDNGRPVLRLDVTTKPLVATHRVYQCYTVDTEHLYRVNIHVEGPFCEHEDEQGQLELAEHPLATQLGALLDDPIPFLEQSLECGEQRFETLIQHAPRREPG